MRTPLAAAKRHQESKLRIRHVASEQRKCPKWKAVCACDCDGKGLTIVSVRGVYRKMVGAKVCVCVCVCKRACVPGLGNARAVGIFVGLSN